MVYGSKILEQLLSNAIKYTKNGIISISFNEKKTILKWKRQWNWY